MSQPNEFDALKASLAGVQPGDFAGPCISERDYSPIRGLYTRYLASNVTESALVYVKELLEAGQVDEAEKWLAWAEIFERGTELGPYHTERIQELRSSLSAQ